MLPSFSDILIFFIKSFTLFYFLILNYFLSKDLNNCAHVKTLERIKHGPFTVEDSLRESEWSLENIQRIIS